LKADLQESAGELFDSLPQGKVTMTDMEDRGRLRLLVTTGSEDLLHGLQRYDLWGRIGFMEIKRRYRRTLIGPFWSTISLAVFIAVMSAVGVGL
jgi:hypothetical protein